MRMKKCQICEGPIVNGRCKWCGMPYRNDETLYHLNENRSEHYKHASKKARAQMKEREIPLADRKPAAAAGKKDYGTLKGRQQKAASTTYTAGKTTYGKTASTYGKTASTYGKTASAYGKTTSAYGKTASAYGKTANGRTGYGTASGKKEKKQGGKVLRWILVLVVLLNALPSFFAYVREEYAGTEVSRIAEELTGYVSEETKVFDLDNSGFSTTLTLEDGAFHVGEDIPAGTYDFYAEEGEASIRSKGENRERVYELTEGTSKRIMLREGEEIQVIYAKPADLVIKISE